MLMVPAGNLMQFRRLIIPQKQFIIIIIIIIIINIIVIILTFQKSISKNYAFLTFLSFLITLFGKCSSNKSHQFFVYYLNPLVSKFFFISVSVYHICSILLPKKPHFSSEKAISFIKWMQILSKVEKLTLLDALKGTKTLRL